MNIINNSNVFNGCVFGKGLVINNGRIVNGGTTKSQKFDETKSEASKNVKKITIISTFCDVDVSSVSSSSKIEAHLHGEAVLDGKLTFDVTMVNHELKIEVKSTGNCFGGNLSLDVSIPKKTFDVLCVKGTSADITLNEGISVDYLMVNTTSGDLETRSCFSSCLISTMSGDVDLLVDASQNITAKISTMSGDVSAEFNNIRHIEASTSTMSGKVKNRNKATGRYNAVLDVSTMSGDISIR